MMLQLQHDIEALSAGRYTVGMTCDPVVSVRGTKLESPSAFSNLASNAARYTPNGGSIRLDWGVRDGHAVYFIIDMGTGTVPEHIPRLTERSYRVNRSCSCDTGGIA